MQQDQSTAGPHYSFRQNFCSQNITYILILGAIEWRSGSRRGTIAFSSFRDIRFYRTFMRGKRAGNKKTVWFCRFTIDSGQEFLISSLHYVEFRTWEDRSPQFHRFVTPLLAELKKSNQRLQVRYKKSRDLRINRLVAAAGSSILIRIVQLIRASNRESFADVTSYVACKIGPRLRAHLVARANLALAFPKKTHQETEQILRGVWDNFGRIPVEFAFVDRLWDYNLDNNSGRRIVIDPTVVERLKLFRARGGPAICFGAHLANWELPGIAAAALGFKSAMVYRPPDSKKLGDELLRMRERVMGQLIPVGPKAALGIRRALRQGFVVGMLADQHSSAGVEVDFFGRRCKVSPTIGRLARRFECPVYGARSIRLPDNRFAIDFTQALDLPRDADGKISVAATMQMVTSVIEGWVREHPEQWLWLHRRWR